MKNKILLIEDNPEVRENTSEILELAGYNVVVAPNGKVGVELAQKENPDLIIASLSFSLPQKPKKRISERE
jgi:DNA-binding response OmpR family regulator